MSAVFYEQFILSTRQKSSIINGCNTKYDWNLPRPLRTSFPCSNNNNNQWRPFPEALRSADTAVKYCSWFRLDTQVIIIVFTTLHVTPCSTMTHGKKVTNGRPLTPLFSSPVSLTKAAPWASGWYGFLQGNLGFLISTVFPAAPVCVLPVLVGPSFGM